MSTIECMFCNTTYAMPGPDACPVCTARANADNLAGLLQEALVKMENSANPPTNLTRRIRAAFGIPEEKKS